MGQGIELASYRHCRHLFHWLLLHRINGNGFFTGKCFVGIWFVDVCVAREGLAESALGQGVRLNLLVMCRYSKKRKPGIGVLVSFLLRL